MSDRTLQNSFKEAFPDCDKEDPLEDVLQWELNHLYRFGIVSRHAMKDYYIHETNLDIIRSCQMREETPTWSY